MRFDVFEAEAVVGGGWTERRMNKMKLAENAEFREYFEDTTAEHREIIVAGVDELYSSAPGGAASIADVCPRRKTNLSRAHRSLPRFGRLVGVGFSRCVSYVWAVVSRPECVRRWRFTDHQTVSAAEQTSMRVPTSDVEFRRCLRTRGRLVGGLGSRRRTASVSYEVRRG